MSENEKLIKEINKTCSIYFQESTFILSEKTAKKYIITGSYASKAINQHKNWNEEVTVIKWFEDIWLYLEIKFTETSTIISLSIFQGEQHIKEKNQLFRAEWDDYNNPDEKHPQPHWHITSNPYIYDSFKEFLKNQENEGFEASITNEKSTVDINRIHFAMNGNWINDESHIHKLNDDNEKLIKWFKGLLPLLKEQLLYVLK